MEKAIALFRKFDKINIKRKSNENAEDATNSLHRKARNSKIKRFIVSVFKYVIIYGLCYVILYPLFTKFGVVFRTEEDMYDFTVNYIPKHFTLENLRLAWKLMEYPKAILHTTIYILLTSVLQVFSCTLVAYGFARFKFPLKWLWFGAVLFMLVIPPQVLRTSLYMHFSYFDIGGIIKLITGKQGIDLMKTQMLPHILLSSTACGLKNSLYVLIVYQQFKGMSRTLEDAAYIDGLGNFRTFFQIMLPNAKPIVVTSFLFSLSWQWTDTFYPRFISTGMHLMQSAVSGVTGVYRKMLLEQFGVESVSGIASPQFELQLKYSAVILGIIPLIIFYIFAQKYFVESIERSGMVE